MPVSAMGGVRATTSGASGITSGRTSGGPRLRPGAAPRWPTSTRTCSGVNETAHRGTSDFKRILLSLRGFRGQGNPDVCKGNGGVPRGRC